MIGFSSLSQLMLGLFHFNHLTWYDLMASRKPRHWTQTSLTTRLCFVKPGHEAARCNLDPGVVPTQLQDFKRFQEH